MTVAEAIRAATERLSATSDTARLDAELLMAHALAVSRSDVLVHRMNDAAPAEFHRLIERREQFEPVAYITGHQEFFGRSFKVTRDTLIPRADSETIVEAALEVLGDPAYVTEGILDLGTGTGALLLSVLAERPGVRGFGIDISAPAVAVARENSRILGLHDRVTFETASWHDLGFQHSSGWKDSTGLYDLVIANPPYVEIDAPLDKDVKDYEPASALFAGKDGLDEYRAIIPELGNLLAHDGAAVLEIGHTQAQAVTKLAENAGFSVEIRNDLANRPRCAILR
ncbi:peptide chain release factor N(5)-glutamine methyltransferase [uncultured Erythrobacter sp.]|uniref:peptide chain release factor N(5)-glutamine methyltransferase n=1 Tax=uncultured Erythrobacter sp. TaxID=263913 RepID=UPI0026383095|nr:peptide chain release factor N(5)-glutamine methyltransferase [uncultured Erythrobacter sp.]